jgi:hypothetical protein
MEYHLPGISSDPLPSYDVHPFWIGRAGEPLPCGASSGTCQLGIDPSPSPRRCPQYYTQASSLFRPGTFSLENPLCSKPGDGEASNYFSGKSLFKLRVVTLLFLGGCVGGRGKVIPKVAQDDGPNNSSREYDRRIHCALRKLLSSIPGVLQLWLAVS